MRVRADRGWKWDNQLWIEFRNEKGFILKLTTSYAYQQNGAVELSMCTILDVAWSMLVDLGLPTKYWPEYCSNHLSQRTNDLQQVNLLGGYIVGSSQENSTRSLC